jgi:hypothetical protein
MGRHADHILTADLRDAYHYIVEQGEQDRAFDVTETGPSPKRSVHFNYANRSARPFAMIVNSGERKDYHLFYIRRPRAGDRLHVEKLFDKSVLNENPKGEITIQIRNREDAIKMWKAVSQIRLQ